MLRIKKPFLFDLRSFKLRRANIPEQTLFAEQIALTIPKGSSQWLDGEVS